MGHTVVVKGAKGWAKVQDVVQKTFEREIRNEQRFWRERIRQAALVIAQSWRIKAAQAPYHRKGPWVRSGGKPLSQSIRVTKLGDNKYGLKVEDTGGNTKYWGPSIYSEIRKSNDGRPLKYKQEAIQTGINILN